MWIRWRRFFKVISYIILLICYFYSILLLDYFLEIWKLLNVQVKYKKHKKKQQSAASMAGFNASALMYNGNFKMESSSPNMTSDICSTVPAGLLSSGNILKTALTNPTEVRKCHTEFFHEVDN